MRFYKIDLAKQDGSPLTPVSLGGMGLTSLLANGQNNPAALNIELDIPVAALHSPQGNSLIRVWGLGLQDLTNSFELNDATISVYGGMSKGLPLANASQAQLLVKGQVFQGFGNWVGTEQTVDMILMPPIGTNAAPLNIILDWTAGMTLGAALSSTLNTAFPTAKRIINLNPRLVLDHDEVGYYGTLTQMASVLNPLSKSIITDPGYPGVSISYDGETVTVSDLYGPPVQTKAIAFEDLIGQPTWIGPFTIQVKTVMRGDIDLFDIVTLPQTLITNTQSALTRFRDKSIFSGNYVVQSIHHWGNFRQPDAASWNTTFEMIPQPSAT